MNMSQHNLPFLDTLLQTCRIWAHSHTHTYAWNPRSCALCALSAKCAVTVRCGVGGAKCAVTVRCGVGGGWLLTYQIFSDSPALGGKTGQHISREGCIGDIEFME